MEMRAIEKIGIGEDLTPPLRPLAAVLHDSAVTSHCSACFFTLPPQTFPPIWRTFPENLQHVPTDTPTPLYCSLACSTADSALHFSSAERHLLSLFAHSPPSSWQDSSDLRLSLRLAHIFQNLPQECSLLPQRSFLEGKNESISQEIEEAKGPDVCLERIAGLMTNRENLVFATKQIEDSDENSENYLRIREGAKMMAKVRNNVNSDKSFPLEEMVLCLVVTNAVEVLLKNGRCIGIAVYDHTFSWINHSCSPNSCYRFLVGPEENDEQLLRLRIAPGGCSYRNGDGSIMEGGLSVQVSDRNGYGPRVVVRSIKAISKGEEVTIAYTDLLQPKEMRQTELWLKYQFNCSCKRCAAVPSSYVDHALQVTSAYNPENPETSDDRIEKSMQNTDFEYAISDYLSSGDAKSCCRKIERFLCYGDISNKSREQKEAKSPQTLKLCPFSYHSLNAYTALASTYKVRASDLLALSYEVERHRLEALHMYKTSSAYSLLLAGVVNHLFMSEAAIVATAANFWMNAGESLLIFWNDAFMKDESIPLELSSLLLTLKCNGCSRVNDLNPVTDQKMQLEEMRRELYICIAKITPKVWSLLSSESSFLKRIKNPVDLRWVESTAAGLEISNTDSQLQVEEVRMNLIMLGIHCFRYGALLSTICYGLSLETNYRRALEGVMKTL